ncbi:MAG TPA: glutamyl-tRNA reductase [Arenimonas sp.]|nr:glutamyl-tRNA reductase [Arenimonas sp.]
MPLIVLGLNHHSAPVELRERVSVSESQQEQALSDLTKQPGVVHTVLLSTCNRTEIYAQIEPGHEHIPAQWLADYHHIELDALSTYLYQHQDVHAVRHLFRVAAGLDSLVMGEPQILGQVKQAWSIARQHDAAHGVLNRLFQHTFAMAKRIRTETQIGANPVSVAYASVKLARQLFSRLDQASVLLIGAGETIELAAQHLANANVKRLLIANRTLEHAQTLASRFSGFALPLAEFNKHLAEVDIVISATASQNIIVHKAEVAKALQQRKHKPMLMIDLAVPRDIDAQVSELEDVYLYTVDDLDQVLEENRASRKLAAVEAQNIIDIQAEHFFAQLKALDYQDGLLKLRAQVEQARDMHLEKAQQALARGENPEHVITMLANQLSNQLLHGPTKALKKAALDGDTKLLQAAEQIFDVNDNVKS